MAVADQAIVSLGGFGLLIAAASQMSADDLGAFVVALVVVNACTGLTGALFNEPAILKAGDPLGQELIRPCRAQGDSAVAALQVGALCSVGVLLASIWTVPTLGSTLKALSAVLPFLVFQDALRYRLIAQRRPGLACICDSTYVGVWFAGCSLVGATQPSDLLLEMGVAAIASSCLALALSGSLPNIATNPVKQILESKRASGALFGEYLTMNLLVQLALLAVTGLLGLSALACLRVAQAAFGPIGVLYNAIRIAVTPEFVRNPPTRRGARRSLRYVGAFAVTVTLLWASALFAISDALGSKLFGSSWLLALPLLAPVAVQCLVGALQIEPLIGLRSIGRVDSASMVRSVGAVLGAGGISIAALSGDVVLVAWTSAAVSVLVAIWLFTTWSVCQRRMAIGMVRAELS